MKGGEINDYNFNSSKNLEKLSLVLMNELLYFLLLM